MRTKLSAAAGWGGGPSCHLQGGVFRSPQRARRENSCSGQGSPDLGTWSPGWGLLTATFSPTAALSVEIIFRPFIPPCPCHWPAGEERTWSLLQEGWTPVCKAPDKPGLQVKCPIMADTMRGGGVGEARVGLRRQK